MQLELAVCKAAVAGEDNEADERREEDGQGGPFHLEPAAEDEEPVNQDDGEGLRQGRPHCQCWVPVIADKIDGDVVAHVQGTGPGTDSQVDDRHLPGLVIGTEEVHNRRCKDVEQDSQDNPQPSCKDDQLAIQVLDPVRMKDLVEREDGGPADPEQEADPVEDVEEGEHQVEGGQPQGASGN